MNHALEKHGRKITRAEIVTMTKTRYYQNDVRRLETLEALIILREDPWINRQDTGKTRTLKLFGTGRLVIPVIQSSNVTNDIIENDQ